MRSPRVSPALASALCDQHDSKPWSKLQDNEPLSQLPSKYWGKSIEVEAKQWRESHPTIVDDPANDIGPGCFMLDLGIDSYPSKLWVRQDYIRIYDYCTARHASGPLTTGKRRSVVLTGQPGVGKTFWLTYAIRRRLGEQEPFLVCQAGDCFLFVEDGVYQQAVNIVRGRHFMPSFWAFIDADDSESDPIPGNLTSLGSKLFIVFPTSPREPRWKTLTKTTACAVVIMNTWFIGEMCQAAKIYLSDEQQKLAEDAFERIGPIARFCIDFILEEDRRSIYEDECWAAASQITTAESLRRFVFEGINLNLGAVSQKIFMVRRQEIDDLKCAYVEPISANIEKRIMVTIKMLQQLDRVNLCRTFVSVNATRMIADLFYESLCHARIEEGITLTLMRMKKRMEQTLAHWRFEGEGQAPDFMNMDDDTEKILCLPPNPAVVYENRLTSIEPNHLHVSSSRNKVGFDSFIILDSILYLFQLTVADSHEIKTRIMTLLSEYESLDLLPPRKKWRFVFITPSESNVDVKAIFEVETFLEGVEMFSAHLQIGDQVGINAAIPGVPWQPGPG